MDNRIEKNARRSGFGILAAALLLVVTGAATTWAGATYHNVPGVSCSAYNNNQANKLERSHTRLLNPATNTSSLWVICGVQRVVEDLAASVAPPEGYFNIFFDAGVTADVTCVARDYNYNSIAIPGGDPDAANTINAVAAVIPPPATLPGVADDGALDFQFLLDDTTDFNFITFACKLPPGTGVNSIDIFQQ